MPTLYVCVLLVLGLPATLSVSTETPESEVPRCKTLFTFDYGYGEFFSLAPNNVQDGNIFTLNFQVKTRCDAHILLSHSVSVEVGDPVYEIVIGAGYNTFSTIRRNQKFNQKTSVSNSILSDREFKGFWVSMNREGLIEVGEKGEELPFMSWQDLEPLDIQYFSFGSWDDVSAEWLYDCDFTDNDIGSFAVETPKSAVDRLREALLTNYDAYSRPIMNSSHLTNISIEIEVNHVNIDTTTSVLSVASSFVLVWYDEKMVWNPDNFDNVSRLNLVHHEIWKPHLIHFNAVGKEVSPFTKTGMHVSSTGRVLWRPKSYLKSHCQLDLVSWPWDTQICSIYLGFLNQPEVFRIFLPENGPTRNLHKTCSDWELMDVNAEIVNVKMPWLTDPTTFLSMGTDDIIYSSAISFTVTVKRLNSGLYYTLIIPLIVIIIMSLACFWMEPLGREKLITNCLLLVLLCGFLISLERTLPAHTDHIPFLFKAYSWVLAVVGCATVVTVLISSLIGLPHLGPPPQFLTKILCSHFFSSLLCLPNPSMIAENYGQLCGLKEQSCPTFWVLLAVMCDRIAFITALIAYTAILVF